MDNHRDFLLLMIDTINNFESINISSRAKKIGDYILSSLYKENLLPKEFLYSLLIFKKVNFKIDDENTIYNIKNKLLQYITKSKNYYLLNNIFLIDILLGNFKQGFKFYFENILTYDFHEGTNSEHTILFSQICTELEKDNKGFIFQLTKDIFKKFFNYKKRERRSILNWIWQCLWANQIVLQKRKEVNEIYNLLKEILYKLIKKEKIDEVMIFSMFIFNIKINVIGESLNTTYTQLQNEITYPCCKLYKKWIEKNKKIFKKNKLVSSNKKIKIAIVRPHIGYWSPFLIEYSLLKFLQSNDEFNKKYEIAVYSFDSLELWAGKGDDPKCKRMFKQANIAYYSPVKEYNSKYGYYVNYLKKFLDFRASIIKDNIDIIIYSDHLYSVGEFLFLSRTAPKQIYWSHGNFAIDVEGIDKRIVHFNDPVRLEGNPYKWEFFDVPIDKDLLNPEEEKYKKEAEKIRKRFPKNSIILGSIGRLTKINNWDYLKTVAEILKQNPETVYLACGPGDQEEIREKIKKLRIEDRFYFEGFVNPHVYCHVIDIYLNTFPEPSGHVIEEFVAKGEDKFVVSLT